MVELERMIRDVLASPQYGVNVILGQSTFDTTDVVPPLIGQIRCTADRQLTFTDQDLVTSTGIPTPALVITVHTPSEGWGEVFSGCRDFVADVSIEYAVRISDAGKATQAAQYTCGPRGAVAQSLAYGLFSSQFRDVNGVRGNYHVKSSTLVTFEPTPRRLQGANVTGASVFQIQMRDTQPLPLIVQSIMLSPTPGVVATVSASYSVIALTRTKQPNIVVSFASTVSQGVWRRLKQRGRKIEVLPRLLYRGVLFTPVRHLTAVKGFVASVQSAVRRRLQQKGQATLVRAPAGRRGIVATPTKRLISVKGFAAAISAVVRRRLQQKGHAVVYGPQPKPRLVTATRMARITVKNYVAAIRRAVEIRIQQNGTVTLLRPVFARYGIKPTALRRPDIVKGFAAAIASVVRRRIQQKGRAVQYGPVPKPRLALATYRFKRIVRQFVPAVQYAVRRRLAQPGHTIQVTPHPKKLLVPTPVRHSRIAVHGYAATIQYQVRRRIAQFGHVIEINPAVLQSSQHGIPTRRPRQPLVYTSAARAMRLYVRTPGRGFPLQTPVMVYGAVPVIGSTGTDEPFYYEG